MPNLSDIAVVAGVPVVAVAGAVAAVIAVYYILRLLGRRSSMAQDLVRRAYRPSLLLAALLAGWLAVRATGGDGWRDPLLHGLLLGVIAAGAWLVTALLNVLTAVALRQLQLDKRDLIAARRIRTRIRLAQRVVLATVSTLAVGVMLITFDEVRALGVSLLASAGLVGVVAALAAQTMLSNFFAGLQLAFSDALRLDDIVVVEGEWGRIEEITLRHVVLKIWDERRLILPTSYFTSNPFENWTRSERQLLGKVEFDLDWSVPVPEMREELHRILADTDLWDGRECALEVIDATGRVVRVWALVSAQDSSAQWALRCLVRERLVAWLQQHHPQALPRVRADFAAGPSPLPAQPTRDGRGTPAP